MKDNIRMDFREIQCEGVDWLHLAQDREQWRTLLNTKKKNIGFYKRRKISWLAECLLATEGLCSIDLLITCMSSARSNVVWNILLGPILWAQNIELIPVLIAT
jgi:hypothetical protein